MKQWRILRLTMVAVVTLLVTSSASAVDLVGAQGRLLALRVNQTSSDNYGIDHGAIVIGDAISGVMTYHWGGSRCPVADLDDLNIAMLQRALDNPRILVEPGWRAGQGGTPCLVRFTLFLRSEQSLTLP